MAKMIDLSKVEELILKQNEQSAPYLHDDTERGSLARFMRDVNLPLTIWRCGEENRTVDPADVAGVIITAFATTMASHIASHCHDENIQSAISAAAMEFMLKANKVLKVADISPDGGNSVCREEVGMA